MAYWKKSSSTISFCLTALLCASARADFGPARLSSLASGQTASAAAANAPAAGCSLSAAGRYLVFHSSATNLASNAVNGRQQIFLRDRRLQRTELVSASSAGTQGNHDSGNAVVTVSSIDNHVYVVFHSLAKNLAAGATGANHIFVRDVTAGTTSKVSGNSADANCAGSGDTPIGCSMAAISQDGRFVVYLAQLGGLRDAVILVDRQAATSLKASGNADGPSNTGVPAISADGSMVVFSSTAGNLTAGDTNGRNDVFVYDRVQATYERVSIPPAGESWDNDPMYLPVSLGPGSLSADGKIVAFGVDIPELLDGIPDKIYLRDRTANTTTLVGDAAPGGDYSLAPKSSDVLRLSSGGLPGAFYSVTVNADSSQLGVQRFFYVDRQGGVEHLTELFQQAEGQSQNREVCMSADGTAVAFQDEPHGKQLYIREIDQCTDDPNKETGGICGCGTADVDSDEDGAWDCEDGCPTDAAKTVPGICGCGMSDTADTDSDGAIDCLDGCPNDPAKTSAGWCGCGVPDLDPDNDGRTDCPIIDNCPSDPNKTEPGVCGCGSPDVNLNGNRQIDCTENPLRRAPAPKLKRLGGGKLQVSMPSVVGSQYEVRYQLGTGKILARRFKSYKAKLSKLKPGAYRVTYRIVVTIGSITIRGPYSKAASLRVT